MNEIKEKIKDLKEEVKRIKEKTSFNEKMEKLKTMETEIQRPDFWGVPEKAATVMKEFKELNDDVNFWLDIDKELISAEKQIQELGNEEAVVDQLMAQILQLEERIKNRSLEIFLSHPYDKNNAVMILAAGQGGRDAEDFCRMLFKMYCNYFEKKGWLYQVLHQHFSEESGGSK